MQLEIRTRVKGNPQEVFSGFNQQLFETLSPPFPPVRVRHFGGCRTGDEVDLELNFLLRKERWLSVVVEDELHGEAPYFVDEGRILPSFLSYWRHEHRIEPDTENPDHSLIVDAITFETPRWLPEALMAPGLWVQFLYRIPVYKRYFSNRARS